jgi:hypothetical protein
LKSIRIPESDRNKKKIPKEKVFRSRKSEEDNNERTKRQTMIYETICRKLTIGQYEPH